MNTPASASTSRYEQLATLLAQDPQNPPLLLDAAEAAFAEERFPEAQQHLAARAATAPLPAPALHLAGLVEMRLLNWDRAAEHFQLLLDSGADAPPVRFNLAWSLAMARKFAEALPLLDDATSAELPQAAQLEVQLLHQLGEFDRAGERARVLIERHPDHRGLNAVVSTLAIDIEDTELAMRCAQQAGDHPDALATLGTLALGEDQPEAAAKLFDAALARNPDAPRAWLGRGLARLLTEDKARAAIEIDRGAELFGTHLGSWIAAGWAHLLAGDRVTARARFDTALALDENFSEAHGSLAVLDLLAGDLVRAKRETEVALRLDRQSFSGALAAMLLLAGAGDQERAQRIFETALNTPIDASGRTIAQSLARLGGRLG